MHRSTKKLLALIFMLFTALGGLTGCELVKKTIRFREDIRMVTFTVPALAEQECSKRLLNLLRGVGGIQKVIPDRSQLTLAVSYNSRDLGQKNILYSISRAGFDVDDTVADPQAKAKLPEVCR
jgi:hypothetical protein